MSFFNELKRRNVFRVAVAYLVLGWVVLQVTDTVAPALRLPEWTLTVVTWFGIIGFPFAVFFAWAFELTPEGIKREHEVDRTQSQTGTTGRKLDFAIIALLVLALGIIVWDAYLSEPASGDAELTQNREASSEMDAEPTPQRIGSIAVLPFTNMSAVGDNVFFAGGVHEEILTNLSRIENLRVVSRTTAMRYINSTQSIREIGEELDVRFIVEGSVRRINNHVRITVQLIDAAEDTHLWASNYDRELVDVFATQSAVAAEITNSLHLEIQPDTVGTLDNMPTRSVKAYDLFIKAKSIERSEGESESKLSGMTQLLEEAVREDPEFASAWGALSETYDTSARVVLEQGWFADDAKSPDELAAELHEKSLHALRKAYALEPDNIETLLARAGNDIGEEDLVDPDVADNSASRKQIMDYTIEKYPDSAMAWYIRCWWHAQHNEREQADACFNKALELDPFHAGIVEGSLYWFRFSANEEMTTRLFERLAQIAPEKGEDKQLGEITAGTRMFNQLFAIAATADESIIDAYAEVLDRSRGSFDSETQELYFEAMLKQLRNDMDGLLELEPKLQLPQNPTGQDLANFSLVGIIMMSAQRLDGRLDDVRRTARALLDAIDMHAETSDDESVQRRYIAAIAHAALSDEQGLSEAKQFLASRGDEAIYDGPFAIMTIASLDPKQAATRILKQKAAYPRWPVTDWLAMLHVHSRGLIIRPELQNFYAEEGKWIDYLAARVPEYAQLQTTTGEN